jgi:hypothetical protein
MEGSMRRLMFVVVGLTAVLALLVGSSTAVATPQGFVTVERRCLDSEPYVFTGINIYNANNTSGCWYSFSTGSTLTESFARIAGEGPKVVRAWFFQGLATSAGSRDWSAIDNTLAVAAAHNTKVIVTFANQWRDCDGVNGGAGIYKDESWYTTGYTQPDPAGTVSYRDWVVEIVDRYKNNPSVLAWQLMNEAEVKPSESAGCSTNAADILRSFADDVSSLIKSIDPNHLVSLGTIGGGQCGAQGAEYQYVHDLDTIDLCEYHDYGSPSDPMPGDQWNGLQVRIDQCNALDKPVFVGETGILKEAYSSLRERAAAFRAKLDAQFDAGVVGELVWAWNRDGSPGSYDIGPYDPTLSMLELYRNGSPPPYTALVGYANGTGRMMRADGPNFQNQQLLGPGQGSPSVRQDGLIAVRDFNAYGIDTQECDGSQLQRLTSPATPDYDPDFSPDGTKIVYGSFATGGLHLMNADGSGPTEQLTTGGWLDMHPDFSPDGTRVAFRRNYGSSGLYVLDLVSGQETRLIEGNIDAPSWSPYGDQIAFVNYFDNQLWMVDADGSNPHALTLGTSTSYVDVEFHPNGNTLAVSHFQSGTANFVVSFIGLNGTNPPSAAIGNMVHVSWAPEGCAPGPPPDTDGDGVSDASDNCRFLANTDQANADGDSLGDACDPDDNNDGIADTLQPSGTASGSFSNLVQGRAGPTTGTIDSGSVTIEDVADPTKGVQISAVTDAVVWVCGPPLPPATLSWRFQRASRSP